MNDMGDKVLEEKVDQQQQEEKIVAVQQQQEEKIVAVQQQQEGRPVMKPLDDCG